MPHLTFTEKTNFCKHRFKFLQPVCFSMARGLPAKVCTRVEQAPSLGKPTDWRRDTQPNDTRPNVAQHSGQHCNPELKFFSCHVSPLNYAGRC